MKKLLTLAGAVGLLSCLLMLGGCGDNNSSSPAVSSAATPVSATLDANGVATTTAAVTPKTSAGAAVLTIPISTTITSSVPFATVPTITISTPTNGTTSGVALAKVGTTSFTVSDSAGAVDISFNTTGAVTLGTPVTVTIPVVKTPLLPISVTAIKTDGSTHTYTVGITYTAASGATGPGVVTVPGVSNFCWFVVNPLFMSPTGSTGSSSQFNIN